MAVERAFMVKLLGDAKQLISEFNKTGKAAEGVFGKGGLGGKLSALVPSFKTVAVAGAAAFGSITAAALAAVKAAAEDQESQKKLADQLRRTTEATDDQVRSVEDYISKTMMATGVTDDELRPAMAALVRATGDVALAQNQLGLATDISAATGRDLATVSLALGRALTGNVGALTRLGIPLDENVKKSKDLNAVVRTLNEQFGGAAKEAADTFSGRLRILRVSIGEAVEGIGYALLPVAERLVKFVQTNVVPVVQAFADELAGGGGLRDALLAAAAEAGDFGLKVVNALEPVAKGVVTLANVFTTLGKPLVAVLGSVSAFIVLITTRSKSAFDDVSGQVVSLYNNIDRLYVSSDSVTSAFANFRADLLAVAATSKKSQGELRALDQAARQAGAGTSNIVKPFVGPLLDRYTAQTKGAADATDDFDDKLRGLSGSAGSASAKVKTAADKLKEYSAVAKDAKSASDAFGRAQSRSADAALSLAEANAEVEKAQTALAVAQAGGSVGQIADAERRVAAARRSQARAGFDIEEAVIAVRDAEKELADLRTNPESSADTIRKAEIALAEAKFRVLDAEDNQVESVRTLNEAQRQLRISTQGLIDGDEELLPLKRELEEALKAQARASENNAEAIRDEAAALDEYRKALADLADIAARFPRIAGANPVDGLIPPVPPPVSPASAAQASQLAALNVTVQAGLATDGAEVGRIIADYLRDFTRIAGPLQAYGLVT